MLFLRRLWDVVRARAAGARAELSRTAFLVASKSGSTTEPNAFLDDRMRPDQNIHLPPGQAVEQFLALDGRSAAGQQPNLEGPSQHFANGSQ